MIRYIRKSFKRELSFGFLITAILPLLMTSGLLIQSFKIKLEADDVRKASAQLEDVGAAVQAQFKKFESVSELLCQDVKLISLMDNIESADKNEVYVRLYVLTEGMRDEAQFDIYSDTGECVCSTGAGVAHEKLLSYWGILRTATARPGKMVLQQVEDENARVLLRAARSILDEEGNPMGYVVISLKKEHFDTMLNGLTGSLDGICILDEFWKTVYSTGVGEVEEIAQVLRYQLLLDEQLSTSYHNSSVSAAAIGSTGLSAVCLRPRTLAEGTIKTMYRVMLAMTLASAGLCIIVAVVMSRNLTRPVRQLTGAMQKVQEGSLDARIETDREDELGMLARHFNHMTVELSEHMERQMRQQRELNETNIAMMQSQLNPHFLYNTLDTMKWVAKANGVDELAIMATKLARILRTSISGEPFITLQEELALVDSYVRIQEIRFSGRFFYQEDVPEELKLCMVPKLMIQPIVENALLHGLENREDGHITVTVRQVEQELLIQVQDDGCGISPEKMEELNDRNHMGKKNGGHLGFYNVDTILRLNYGEEYGLHVSGREEGGTLVTMRLPVVL